MASTIADLSRDGYCAGKIREALGRMFPGVEVEIDRYETSGDDNGFMAVIMAVMIGNSPTLFEMQHFGVLASDYGVNIRRPEPVKQSPYSPSALRTVKRFVKANRLADDEVLPRLMEWSDSPYEAVTKLMQLDLSGGKNR
jgi:hypothetical protein